MACCAGMWGAYVDCRAPRDFGLSEGGLDRNGSALLRKCAGGDPSLPSILPAAEECLVVPFFVKGEAVGTVWAIMHSNRRKFDAEDERIMMSAVRFASRAYQIQRPAEDFAVEIGAREEAQTKMRQLIGALESKVECLFASSIIGIVIWNFSMVRSSKPMRPFLE